MKNNPLVSIITPCYNGETYVHRLLDSVLSQTYMNIELIFINDGSTDRTEEIALSYEEKFERRGIEYVYIYQENAGQAAAVNRGLKIFKGDYLTWPDSDDWMTDDCIEKKVNFLEQHPELGMMMCRTAVVDEDDTSKVVATLYRRDTHIDGIFEDLLLERDVYFAPIGYMARSSDFLDANPSREIYAGNGGQNWQMLLPLAHRYKCGYLDEILGFYLTRNSSHSRIDKSYEEKIEKYKRYECTLINTLYDMKMDDQERNKYIEKVSQHHDKIRFELAFAYRDIKNLKDAYKKMRRCKRATFKHKMMYMICRSRVLYWIYKKTKT